jgi:hypothetical protein
MDYGEEIKCIRDVAGCGLETGIQHKCDKVSLE